MSNKKLFSDTNALIYLLNGDSRVYNIFLDAEIVISFVSEIELKSKKNLTFLELEEIKSLLGTCTIFNINSEIKDLTAEIRRNSGLKLPDAIIAATSILYKIPLVSADKIFSRIEGINLVSI